MTRRQALKISGILLASLVLGIGAVIASPTGGHIGFLWPVGLISGVVLVAPRAYTPVIVGVSIVIVTVSYAVSDLHGVAVALGFGVGVAVEALVIQRILTVGYTQTWRMHDLNDLGRFVSACLLGSFAGALVFAGVSALNDFGDPLQIGVATFAIHLVAESMLLGLFRSEHAHGEETYGSAERSMTWGLSILVTTIAFIPTNLPSVAFLVIPILGWMAFRASSWEANVQLCTVGGIAAVLSGQGLGPFDNAQLHQHYPELQDLPVGAFLIACAMISIPFSLAVSMQRRSAQQLVQERARSERLVQSARGIAIIGTDRLGRINLFSPGAESILGYAPEEVYGQSTRMFHTESELARHAAELGSDPTYVSVVQATGELPPGTARVWQFVRKDGIPRTLSTILSPINDDNGDFVGYVATADDITDRMDAEAALEKALATERRAVKRLTEIDQVKDQFVSSVSHELRTPITNIVGYLELLMDGVYGEPNDRQHDAMERIDLNSRRLLTLIDDLLTLSSMESIDRRRRRGLVDLVTVVARAEEMVRPSVTRRDLVLEVDAPEDPVPLVGDAGELERLVINFATNAVKFTPDGGRIVIRLVAGTEENGPVLEVEDNGIGIRDEDRAKLFTRFFRTTRAHELGVPGSGLGLSIAKAIADVHGGRISAHSVYGKGSTFRVEFPVTVESPAP